MHLERTVGTNWSAVIQLIDLELCAVELCVFQYTYMYQLDLES